MRVMLSEIDFERFVSKITEANNKKGEGKGREGKRIGSMSSIYLSEFLTRGGVSYSLVFFCYSLQEDYTHTHIYI